MTLISEWRCWQIMQCDPEARCPAKEISSEECWDIMGSHNPSAFNICRDCLVYVAKKNDSSLSPEEVINILTQKGISRQATED
jgi:hypothetical protein